MEAGDLLQIIAIIKKKVDDGETNENLSEFVSDMKMVMPRCFEDQMWNCREKEKSRMIPKV